MTRYSEQRPPISVPVDIAEERERLLDKIGRYHADTSTKPVGRQLNNVYHSPQQFVAYLAFEDALKNSGIDPH